MAERVSGRLLQVASFDRESLNFALLQIQRQLDEVRGLRGDVTIFNNTTIQGTTTVTGILTLGAANFATIATLAAIADGEFAGTSTLVPRGDHIHDHGSGYLPNAHHNQSHVLATGTALGPDHTISGAAAGEVLRALSATTAAFDVLALSDVSPRAHATLTSLTVDDHTQYALLAGRAGGQIYIGGTASGDDLKLRSTDNSTKGSVFIGAADEMEWEDVLKILRLAHTITAGGSNDIGVINITSNFTGATTNAFKGISVKPTFTPPTTIGFGCIGVEGNVTAAPASGANIPLLAGLYFGTNSATSSGTITEAVTCLLEAPSYVGPKPTTQYGLKINNQFVTGITTAVGIRLVVPSGGGGYNFEFTENDTTAAGAYVSRIRVAVAGVGDRFIHLFAA